MNAASVFVSISDTTDLTVKVVASGGPPFLSVRLGDALRMHFNNPAAVREFTAELSTGATELDRAQTTEVSPL